MHSLRMNILIILNIWKNNGTKEIGLVIPTPCLGRESQALSCFKPCLCDTKNGMCVINRRYTPLGLIIELYDNDMYMCMYVCIYIYKIR